MTTTDHHLPNPYALVVSFIGTFIQVQFFVLYPHVHVFNLGTYLVFSPGEKKNTIFICLRIFFHETGNAFIVLCLQKQSDLHKVAWMRVRRMITSKKMKQ